MKLLYTVSIALLITLTFLIFAACTTSANTTPDRITSFEECVNAGFPVYRTFPPRCRTPDGLVFSDERRAEPKLCKDLCGDGICQEIVCMGSGCPCPEDTKTCPEDCKISARDNLAIES